MQGILYCQLFTMAGAVVSVKNNNDMSPVFAVGQLI
jgi:hypothetical protein